MARTVRQLRATQQELAENARAETRLGFARDLHDLLGLSLSAITMKTDLALRLISRDPVRAGAVVADMVEISRHALADVRLVAGGHVQMSLEQECRTAESLLRTAGLAVRMSVENHADLPSVVSTALATVLREGVTNVLRHSNGEACEITIHRDGDGVRLKLTNDGVAHPAERTAGGSGIRNLSERVGALGGVLTAHPDGAGRFALDAIVPRNGRPHGRDGSGTSADPAG